MLFTIDIAKDTYDYIWGWSETISSVLGAILIPVLVWFFGSSRAEANRENKEKQNSLNYLLTSSYRYFQYFVNLKQMVINKQIAMMQFLREPTEENKVKAFSISSPPAVDFDIMPNKYNFTITKEHLIVDIIFHFLQVLSDINGTLEYINSGMMKIFDDDMSIESFVKIAQGHTSTNIPGLIFKINMGLYMTFRLIEIVEDYNKYLNKNYKLMTFYIPSQIISQIDEIKMEITSFLGNTHWEEPFMKTEVKKTKPEYH